MKNGFNITCLECNEQIIFNKNFRKEADVLKLTATVMGSYPFHSLYLVCSNCSNEIEVEI